jgi:ATP-dependent helicase/nuclease subunit B
MPQTEMDSWLRSGGRVVAASDRAARAVLAAYHRQRQAEGLAAWPAPNVFAWQAFVRQEWERRKLPDGLLILNAAQEQTLWTGIIRASGPKTGQVAGLLPGPQRRLARLCMEAHGLLCAYAPHLLERKTRRGWTQDAAVFSEWLDEFDSECRAKKLISPERIPEELTGLLRDKSGAHAESRPTLVLTGFDRLTPEQERLFGEWGQWNLSAAGQRANDVRSYVAADQGAELTACARWCRTQLDANPVARLLVVTQGAREHRGEIERVFLREGVTAEWTLGVPLGTVGIVRAAAMLLQWLDGSLAENEIDWLFAVPYVGSAQERGKLQAFHRGIRRRGLQRPRWTLEGFLNQRAGVALPETWALRMKSARERLRTEARRPRKPLEWTEFVPELLRETGFPGDESRTSSEFQATRRWEQALEICGSLGFDGQRMAWREFFDELAQTLETTLFAAESEDAPVLIAGPAESAGIRADGVWFLGADEDSWPGRGTLNPLIPFEVQHSAKMPHATAQQDRELAQAMTERLLRSAAVARFSYARLKDNVEGRGSRLIANTTGKAEMMPLDLTERIATETRTLHIVDAERIPFLTTDGAVAGGAEVITAQSLCGFQAFAQGRLDARQWDAAEAGLTAQVRGNLLHEALDGVWGGAETGGIRTFEELKALPDLIAFVAPHVRTAMRVKLPAGARERMPLRYLELEEQRLTRLVTEWLRYEATRQKFAVEGTELKQEVTIAGLTLQLRLDRVDRLNDSSLLVIDYKTGNVSPKEWNFPRPEDAQLPLYASLALPKDSDAGGLVFAKVRTGTKDMGFVGSVREARTTLISGLHGANGLVKYPLTTEQLEAWRTTIEELALDFLAGQADVNPREMPETCERCGLQALCRVHETAAYMGDAGAEEEGEDE